MALSHRIRDSFVLDSAITSAFEYNSYALSFGIVFEAIRVLSSPDISGRVNPEIPAFFDSSISDETILS